MAEMAQKDRAQFLRENPYQPCGECDEGMVLVDSEGRPYDWRKGGTRFMRECFCKRQWRKRVGVIPAANVSDGKLRGSGQ